MKPTFFVLVSLALGIAIGVALTRQEFARDVLPLGKPLSESPASSQKSTSQAQAVVTNGERHNFGTMNRGTTGEHTFTIRNDGTAPLKLAKGKSTCKCTTFEIDQNTLAPGETTSVLLKWEPKQAESIFEQSAEVILENDPARQTISLVVSGRVIDLVHLDRPDLLLTDISANEPLQMRMKIFAYRGDRLTIEKHEWVSPTHSDKLQVRFEPLTAEEIAAEPDATTGTALLLDVDRGMPLGPLEETLKLTTNFTEIGPLEVRIRGSVASDLSLAGPRVVPEKLLVNLGIVPQATGIRTTVYLLVKGPFRDETTLSLTGSELAGDLKATLGEPDRTSPRIVRYPLVLEIPAGSTPVARASEGGYARLKLATTHPQTKEMTLNIRYVVKQ